MHPGEAALAAAALDLVEEGPPDPQVALVAGRDEDPELARVRGDVVDPDAADDASAGVRATRISPAAICACTSATVVRVAPSTHIPASATA